MSSATSGRPKGTQNRPGHSAGGFRAGAGRKRKVRIDSPEMAASDEDTEEMVNASSSAAPGKSFF